MSGDRRLAMTVRFSCERQVKTNAGSILIQAMQAIQKCINRSRVSCVHGRNCPDANRSSLFPTGLFQRKLGNDSQDLERIPYGADLSLQ